MKDIVVTTINDDVVEVEIPTTSEKKETYKIEDRVSSAIKFKLKHGYSKTMGKLMKKYNCKTIEEYRNVRKLNRLERKLK